MAAEHAAIGPLILVIRKSFGFFLRWLFPVKKLESRVLVDVNPRHEGVVVDLGERATYRIWLLVTNTLPFAVEIEQGSFQFWCGGSILKSHSFDRKKIGTGEIVAIYLNDIIPDGHANAIAREHEGSHYAIEGTIRMSCMVNTFTKNLGHLEGIRPRIVNQSHRASRA